MASAQNSFHKLLSISIESFIVTIVRHSRSASPFSLCLYRAAYFIEMPLFSRKVQSLCDMNFPLPSALSIFIIYPDLISARGSYIWNVSMKLSFPHKYKIEVFPVCSHSSITAYMLPVWEGRSCGSYILACIPSSLLVVGVMLLFLQTTWVDFFSTHGVHSLSNALLLSISILIWYAELESITYFKIGWCVETGLTRKLSPELSKFSESTNTSVGFYSFVGLMLIPSTSLETLITRALLTWVNRQYQGLIRLFLLIG